MKEKILNYLAENNDRWVTFEEIDKQEFCKSNILRAHLTQLKNATMMRKKGLGKTAIYSLSKNAIRIYNEEGQFYEPRTWRNRKILRRFEPHIWRERKKSVKNT